MTQQYLRKLSLIVADTTGKGVELGALRVTFEVRRGDNQTPNTLDCKVYNLSAQTSNLLRHRGAPEFTQVQLRVAYGDQPLAQIFYGQIKQVRQGREDGKNSYIAITAADGDSAYNFAVSAFTLAAGHTPLTAVQHIVANMAAISQAAGSPTGGGGGQPITLGPMATLDQNRCIRGRTYSGSCKDLLHQIAADQDCKWSIQDGAVTFIPATGYIPGPPVLITPQTGLIGVPESTQNGLSVRTLLNPVVKIGGLIKLDTRLDVNQLRLGTDLTSRPFNKNINETVGRISSDGTYYVMRAEHFGDTRGNVWYSDLTCLSVDITVQPLNPIPGSRAILPENAIQRY